MSRKIGCDDRGYCKQHPQIRLRKRNAFGRWKTALTCCPICSVTHLDNSDLVNQNLPFKLCRQECTDYCSSSASTIGNVSTSYSFSSSSIKQSSLSPDDKADSSYDCQRRIVCGMRYKCPVTGHNGSYTGQVDTLTLLPHGIGTLRYDNGVLCEGKWCRGNLKHKVGDAKQQIALKKTVTFNTTEHLQLNNSLFGEDINNEGEDHLPRDEDVNLAISKLIPCYSAKEIKQTQESHFLDPPGSVKYCRH